MRLAEGRFLGPLSKIAALFARSCVCFGRGVRCEHHHQRTVTQSRTFLRPRDHSTNARGSQTERALMPTAHRWRGRRSFVLFLIPLSHPRPYIRFRRDGHSRPCSARCPQPARCILFLIDQRRARTNYAYQFPHPSIVFQKTGP